MVRRRLAAYRDRIRAELESAFAEEHTPHEIAASFAVGVFVTALPTLGLGLLVFVAIVAVVERASKLALFASVLVLNPVVKWGVYAASYWLGARLLGPVGGAAIVDPSFSAGPDVLARLLVGNLLLAVGFTVVGYVAVRRLVHVYRRRDLDVADVLPESLAE